MNNRLLREYYLDDINNIFFLASMLILEISVVMRAFLEPIQDYLNTHSILTTLIYPTLLVVIPAVIAYVVNYLKTKQKGRYNNALKIFDNFHDYCERQYPNDILNSLGLYNTEGLISNIVVLYGESGSGKTTIVNKVKESVASIEPYDTDYNTDIGNDLERKQNKNPESFKQNELIIFDHFERFLQFNTYGQNKSIDYIVQLSLTKKVLIVIRKEFFADLYCQIEHAPKRKDIRCKYLFVDNKADTEAITGYFRSHIEKKGETLSESETQVVNKIVEDINNISFVEINAILNLVNGKKEPLTVLGIKLVDLEDGIKNLITQRLEVLLDESEFKDIIFPILYLMCLDYKHQHYNKIIDFVNITIDDLENVMEGVKYLLQIGLIKENKEKNKVGPENIYYEIAHDYYFDVLNVVFSKKMDQRICDNIKRYYLYCSIPKFQGTERTKRKEESDKNKDRRERTTKSIEVLLDSTTNPEGEKKSEDKRTYIIVWYYLAAFIIIAGNIIGLYHMGNDFKFLSFVFININVSFSYFYSYNWFMHFLSRFRGKIFNMRHWKLLVLGIFTCFLPYLENFASYILDTNYSNNNVMLFKNLWGFALGVPIICSGIVMLKMRRDVEGEEEKHFFKQKGIIFCLSGLIITCLSIILNNNPHIDKTIEIGFYLLYMIFIISAIYQHINKRFLKIVVGKTLYWPNENR